MKTNFRNRFAIIITALLLCSVSAFAQPEENGGDPPINDAPLDGGLSVLIAAGVGYGIKKARDNRQSRKKNV
jgi:hypothetical protein